MSNSRPYFCCICVTLIRREYRRGGEFLIHLEVTRKVGFASRGCEFHLVPGFQCYQLIVYSRPA